MVIDGVREGVKNGRERSLMYEGRDTRGVSVRRVSRGPRLVG